MGELPRAAGRTAIVRRRTELSAMKELRRISRLSILSLALAATEQESPVLEVLWRFPRVGRAKFPDNGGR
jgi:hypothetical protein